MTGVAALTLTNTSNSLMQRSTEPAMRRRVMALRVGVALGVGAGSGFMAAAVAVCILARQIDRPLSRGPTAGRDGASGD